MLGVLTSRRDAWTSKGVGSKSDAEESMVWGGSEEGGRKVKLIRSEGCFQTQVTVAGPWRGWGSVTLAQLGTQAHSEEGQWMTSQK